MYGEVWRYQGDGLFYVVDGDGERLSRGFTAWVQAVEWAIRHGYHNRNWCEWMMWEGCQLCEHDKGKR